MRPYPVTIDPGTVEEFAVTGDYVRLKTANVAVVFLVEETGESIELEPGDDVNLTPFKRLKVMHASGSTQAIVFYVGNGTRAGSSKVGGAVAVSSLPSPAVPVVQGLSVAGANIQLLPANAARSFLMMQNIGNGDIFFTLDGSAAAPGAFILKPGATIILDARTCSGAIRVDDPSGSGLAYCEG